MCILESTSMFT